MGYLLFCGYYFFRPFRAPPAVLCESGYLLERFLRAKGELQKRKDRCGGGTTHISSYVVICLHMSPFVPIWLRGKDLIRLAVPEKCCGLTLFLAFFDRCRN